jgi:3,4-dihydroxy 2-butanone 4-phosphate synthase/GTP cyclohydrolase II
MVVENRETYRTDFTVTVDAAKGISTGISAHDRAKTIAVLVDPSAKPTDLVQPGHVFPLRAKAAACCAAPGTPKRASILRGWPGCSRPE